MTYQEALACWFGRINYEQRTPGPGDLNLDRMRALLRRLGQPQERLRIVHVAGSKGKGSTAAMLADILRRAGYRTGLFTSPHLSRPEERVQVDGVAISSEELTALIDEIRRLEEKAFADCPEGRPTFFELCTAIGFLHFARRRVDVAVVEVGLGGRFDATNVCRPLVSLITSISLDHTQQLGHRLADIAMEKAGIVKPGVPVISGVTNEEAAPVIERICGQRQAPLCRLERDFQYTHEPGQVGAGERAARVHITTRKRRWPAMDLGLLGRHQAANAAVAVATIEQLRQDGLRIPDAAVIDGLGQVFWPARLEVLRRRPLVVLDCAHNVASAQALVDTLRASFPAGRRLLVFAGSNDKDLAGMLRVLAPEFSHAYMTRFRNSPRGVPPAELVELALAAGLPAELGESAHAAWARAEADAEPDDLICITGSVFLAGELRRKLG